MPDNFAGYADSAISPASRGAAVIPSDTTDLTDIPKALYVGIGGDVSCVGVSAAAGSPGVIFKNVGDGVILPFRARRVLASGTTAASILALY